MRLTMLYLACKYLLIFQIVFQLLWLQVWCVHMALLRLFYVYVLNYGDRVTDSVSVCSLPSRRNRKGDDFTAWCSSPSFVSVLISTHELYTQLRYLEEMEKSFLYEWLKIHCKIPFIFLSLYNNIIKLHFKKKNLISTVRNY